MKTFLARLCLAASLAVMFFAAVGKGHAQANVSYEIGERDAQQFAYGYGGISGAHIAIGFTGTGTQTALICPAIRTTADGRNVNLFAVDASISFDTGTAVAETVTPTSVSLVTAPSGVEASQQCANVTASFTNAHAASQNVYQVRSGTFGLQEAINDAVGFGASGPGLSSSAGGPVTVGPNWGGTDATIYGAVPFWNAPIIDKRKGIPQYWNPRSNTTVLATPAALTAQAACDATHTFCSDASVAGSASWGGAVYGCVTYVDVMGNESLCSTTANFTSVASKAIDIGAPAASTGAVGWKPYLSLSGGSYALAYSVPLLLQPTVLQAIPLTSGVCTLEYISPIPACAITNATYGETASATGAAGLFTAGGAQFTLYPLVTSVLAPNLDSASAQSLNPQSGGHTVYKYVPGSSLGIPGVMASSQTFPVTTAAQSTIGQVAGTIKLPANFMNFVGRSIEVCGMISKTSTNADTITNIQLWWDNEGSNVTAGTAVQLTNLIITQTNTAAATYSFCQDITTTVAATTATGGTILPGEGWMTTTQVAAGTLFGGAANSLFAAVGSLNLALPANLEIVLNHTTGTDGAGATLVNPTVKILN